MSRRRRPAPPTYMQPTYPPKFPSASSHASKQPLPSTHSKSPPSADPDFVLPSNATAERLEQLKTLGELYDSGVLSEQEFEREKQRILDQP